MDNGNMLERIEDLRIFARVAELASFTAAAMALGLPKANVSAAVVRLEEAVGTRLLQRTTRKVQLTQDGAAFYQRCLDLIADLDEVGGMFRKGELSGRLRVDMPVGFARSLVIPRLGGFLARHPALEVEVGCTDRRVDLIREGFDCVVRVGTLESSDLIVRPLGALTIASCASPAYLRRAGKPRTIDDLRNGRHHLVHYTPTFGAGRDRFEYFDGAAYQQIDLPGAVAVNNADAYTAACLAGLGIIQAPLVGVSPHIERGELVEILSDKRAEAMAVSIVYPHRRNLAQRVRVFMGWLEEIVREYAR